MTFALVFTVIKRLADLLLTSQSGVILPGYMLKFYTATEKNLAFTINKEILYKQDRFRVFV